MSARPESTVRPEFGPSLPQLLRARFGLPVRLTTGLAVLVVLAAAALALTSREGEVRVVHRAAPVFNLRHAKVLHRTDHPGVLLELTGRRGELFLQSMTIRALHLPPYRSAVSSVLPILAADHMREVARGYRAFRTGEEGKARINDAPGYQVGFRARRGERTIYGKEIMLVPDEPRARDGVVITLLQTNAAGAHRVEDVGAVGALKKPFRSFRFGTEAE